MPMQSLPKSHDLAQLGYHTDIGNVVPPLCILTGWSSTHCTELDK